MNNLLKILLICLFERKPFTGGSLEEVVMVSEASGLSGNWNRAITHSILLPDRRAQNDSALEKNQILRNPSCQTIIKANRCTNSCWILWENFSKLFLVRVSVSKNNQLRIGLFHKGGIISNSKSKPFC